MFGKNRLNHPLSDTGPLIYADTQSGEAPKKTGTGRWLHMRSVAILAVTVLAAMMLVLFVGLGIRSREDSYQLARQLAEQKDYAAAMEEYTSLGDYRDSKSQLANLEANQAAYAAAADLLEQQRYDEAIAAFRALGDYADSAEQAAYHVTYQKALDLLTEIDTGKTHLLTRILTDEVRLTDEKSYPTIVGYEAAAALLESLGDYRSAPALVDRCYYSAGLVKLGWEDWEGALAYMEKMTQETAAEFYQDYEQHYNEKAGEDLP